MLPRKRGAPKTLFETSRKVAKLEKKMALKTPELKYIDTFVGTVVNTGTVQSISICDIGQGTANGERVGNKVKVVRIQVRGTIINDRSVPYFPTFHIWQSKSNSNPTTGDFPGLDGNVIDARKYVEWFYHAPFTDAENSGNSCTGQVRFPNGLIVHYDGSATTAQVRNKLGYTIVNSSGTNQTPSLVIRVWYYDV